MMNDEESVILEIGATHKTGFRKMKNSGGLAIVRTHPFSCKVCLLDLHHENSK
jgi:hypothetical protein